MSDQSGDESGVHNLTPDEVSRGHFSRCWRARELDAPDGAAKLKLVTVASSPRAD